MEAVCPGSSACRMGTGEGGSVLSPGHTGLPVLLPRVWPRLVTKRLLSAQQRVPTLPGEHTDPGYLPITLRACCSCGAARWLTVLVGSAVGMITPGDEAVPVNATARGTLSPREGHPQPRLLPWEHVGLTPTAHQSGKIFSQTFLVNHADQSK